MTDRDRTNSFKRGDRVVDYHGNTGVVLGPEDFDGYQYNRPRGEWELVLWDGTVRAWTPRWQCRLQQMTSGESKAAK